MTKPFRIALKIWLICCVLCLAFALNTYLFQDAGYPWRVAMILFIDFLFIGLIGVVVFFEKITEVKR